MSKEQCYKTKMSTKNSITQRLRADLERSVGVTTATQLVWLTGYQAKPSLSQQQPCSQNE